MPFRTYDWLSVCWQNLKFTKRRILTGYRAKNNRNNMDFSFLISLHCSSHLFAITVLRNHKIWTNKQENNLCGIKVLFDFLFPFNSGIDICISPNSDKSLILQWHKVRLEFV